MSKKAIELASRYRRKYWREVDMSIFETYHVNAFVHPKFPIITEKEEIQVFQWGLIPHWVKSEEQAKEIENMTINAKSETVFEKPSFRGEIRSQRCLVPSTGFFEWRHEKDKKIPYFIHLKNEEVFSFAGIYDNWVNPETGELINTFSIITTTANPLMEFIHNTKKRMPVILPREMEENWLLPDLSKQQILDFLKPYDEKEMEAYQVESFLKKSPDDASIIEPVKVN